MESAGSVEIPCNPSEDHPPNKAPALSVSCESLTTSNGHQVADCSIVYSSTQMIFVEALFREL